MWAPKVRSYARGGGGWGSGKVLKKNGAISCILGCFLAQISFRVYLILDTFTCSHFLSWRLTIIGATSYRISQFNWCGMPYQPNVLVRRMPHPCLRPCNTVFYKAFFLRSRVPGGQSVVYRTREPEIAGSILGSTNFWRLMIVIATGFIFISPSSLISVDISTMLIGRSSHFELPITTYLVHDWLW